MRFLFGLAIGYTVVLLIAPSEGKVTRARLKDYIDSRAREKAKEIGARAGEMAYEEMKHAV